MSNEVAQAGGIAQAELWVMQYRSFVNNTDERLMLQYQGVDFDLRRYCEIRVW